MSLKETLSSNIKVNLDFPKGSLLDQSGNGNDCTTTDCVWENTNKGHALRLNGSSSLIDVGNTGESLKSLFIIFQEDDISANTDYLVDLNGTDYITVVNGTVTVNGFGGATTNVFVNGIDTNTIANTNDFNYVLITSDTGFSASDLDIGRLEGTGFLGGKVRKFLGFDTELTAAQAAQLYTESLEEPWPGDLPKRNFELPALYDGSEPDNVGAWNMSPESGVVPDVSGGNNHLTAIGGENYCPGVGGLAACFNGVNSHLYKAVANYRSADSAGSIEGWVIFRSTGANEFGIFSSSDEGSSTRYISFFKNSSDQLAYQQRNNGQLDHLKGSTTLPLTWPFYARINSDGDTITIHLNNTAETVTVVGGENRGNWFAETDNRDNITIGSLKYSGELFSDLISHGVLVSSAVQSNAEYEKRYLKAASKLTYYNDFSDAPITLGASSTDLGGFNAISGTHKISEDSAGQKWLENVTAGITATPSEQPYGTWEFKVNKAAASALSVYFVNDSSTAIGNGYAVVINGAESVRLYTVSGGSLGVAILASNAAYIVAGTDYTFRVTRSLAAVFTLYIKGGAYTTWTLVDSSAAGTNPVSNATYQTCAGFLVDADAGDKVSNLRFTLGDVTPTQMP